LYWLIVSACCIAIFSNRVTDKICSTVYGEAFRLCCFLMIASWFRLVRLGLYTKRRRCSVFCKNSVREGACSAECRIYIFHQVDLYAAKFHHTGYQRSGLVGVELVGNGDPFCFEVSGRDSADLADKVLFRAGVSEGGLSYKYNSCQSKPISMCPLYGTSQPFNFIRLLEGLGLF
jgi:hypothetical protein